LDAYEAEITAQRASEPIPEGDLDYEHYKAIHHHLFQDVYAWAGEIRHVRIAKHGNAFCYPEYIDDQMEKLFAEFAEAGHLQDRNAEDFAAAAAHFLAELNAIHPFREGNGRTQLSFLTLLAEQAGHPLSIEHLDPRQILQATIASFGGNEAQLAAVISELISLSPPDERPEQED
jgi:cell filamentation protein